MPLVASTSVLVIAAAVVIRLGAAVAVVAFAAVPGLSARVLTALVLALSLAAWPAACAAVPAGAALGPWPLVLAGEALVGLVIGAALAAVLAAAGQAGSILGSAAGLSWADDFSDTGGEQTAGVGRLAWWVGLAAFCATGGHLGVVAGLVDGVRTLPVGGLFAAHPAAGWPPEWLVTLAVTAPTTAIALAVTLAAPALAAVVAFHLASAICLRAVPFAPAAGLLQGLAALVLLAAFTAGLDVWASGCGTLMHAAVERITK
jgi:flagellar biosynthetic protein FliR